MNGGGPISGQNKNGAGGVNGGNINVNDLHGMPNMTRMSSGGGGLGPMSHMGAVQGLPAGAMMSSSRSPNGYLQGLG